MSIDKVEIVREVAEFACQNLQRILNETSNYTKSFEWDEISETLLINNSTFIKMKRIRDNEDDDWGTYDPLKQWQNGNEEEEEEKEEEEEEEEEVEPPFLPHPPMYGKITWESIAESLSQGVLPSTLYKELPREVYFTFKVCILEEHRRYLKNEIHLSPTEIDESDEMSESFLLLEDVLAYWFD
jgi:hypothetical protein